MTKFGGSVKLEKAWNIIQVIELQLLKGDEVRVYKVHGCSLELTAGIFYYQMIVHSLEKIIR